MFEVVLILCSVALPVDCIRLRDARGPYEDEKVCRTRITEMQTRISDLFPPHTFIASCVWIEVEDS